MDFYPRAPYLIQMLDAHCLVSKKQNKYTPVNTSFITVATKVAASYWQQQQTATAAQKHVSLDGIHDVSPSREHPC